MAYAVDVIFSGLMLICLNGKSDCYDKTTGLNNSAYALHAQARETTTCGWNSPEQTAFYGPVIVFKAETCELVVVDDTFLETCTKSRNANGESLCSCNLTGPPNFCLSAKDNSTAPSYGLDGLVRIDELDSRFKNLRPGVLKESAVVSAGIHFSGGAFTTAVPWKVDGLPVLWDASKGGVAGFPRPLTNEPKVSYLAKAIELTDCGRTTLARLNPTEATTITIQNFSIERPLPDHDSAAGYDYLPFLLWYYQLAEWKTANDACPTYTGVNRDAVVLRCVRGNFKSCAHEPKAAYSSVIWPTMLGPKP